MPDEFATLRDLTSLENSVDLKLANIRSEMEHRKELVDSKLRASDDLHDGTYKTVTDHEARLKGLEGKDLAEKAGRYDKTVKWALGILTTAVGTWALMNLNNILSFIATFQPKGVTP